MRAQYSEVLALEEALRKIERRLKGCSSERFSKSREIQKAIKENFHVIVSLKNLFTPDISLLVEKVQTDFSSESWKEVWSFLKSKTDLLQEHTNHMLLETSPKVHPFRMCPLGFYHVSKHAREVTPSLKHPDGFTSVREHCRRNPSHRDQMYPVDIKEIIQNHFKKSPDVCSENMGYVDGSKYDTVIQGWTDYWNDVIKTEPPLDPNIVKALIASESGFRAHPPDQKTKSEGKARGILQLTDKTIKTLNNEKGEAKDHTINLSQSDIYDPEISICAGIRWLHQKHRLATLKLGRAATWEEAVAQYKGRLKSYSNALEKEKAPDMGPFLREYKKIKNCRGKK